MALERELRDLSYVPRWGILRCIHTQSVAEHSFYVAVYADWVARKIEWNGPYTQLIRHALWHDAEECFMSDIPGPSKRAIRDDNKYEEFVGKELSKRFGGEIPAGYERWEKDIKSIIKVADIIDEVLYLASERQMGNNSIVKFMRLSEDRLESVIQNLNCEQHLKIKLESEINHAVQRALYGFSISP